MTNDPRFWGPQSTTEQADSDRTALSEEWTAPYVSPSEAADWRQRAVFAEHHMQAQDAHIQELLKTLDWTLTNHDEVYHRLNTSIEARDREIVRLQRRIAELELFQDII